MQIFKSGWGQVAILMTVLLGGYFYMENLKKKKAAEAVEKPV